VLRSILVAALVIAPSTALAQPPKFAFVDVQQVMEATPQWKKSIASFQKERAEKQAALEAKQKDLKQKKDRLDAQKAVSDSNSSAQAEEELYKDADALTQGFLQTQKELNEREKKFTDELLKRIEAIVNELATEANYDYVFEAGTKENPNVLYAPKALNITQRVIAEYLKRFKDKPLQ
jgi:outer membrane protein